MTAVGRLAVSAVVAARVGECMVEVLTMAVRRAAALMAEASKAAAARAGDTTVGVTMAVGTRAAEHAAVASTAAAARAAEQLAGWHSKHKSARLRADTLHHSHHA